MKLTCFLEEDPFQSKASSSDKREFYHLIINLIKKKNDEIELVII